MSAGILLCAPHPGLGWAAHTPRSPLQGDEVIPDSEHHPIWAHSHWVHGLCIWAISPRELGAGSPAFGVIPHAQQLWIKMF